MKEAVVEAYLTAQVAERGGWCVKLMPASHAGLPDRIIFLPDGTTRLAELKRPKGGRLAEVQIRVHARLARIGHPVVVLWSKHDVDTWLDSL